MSSVAKVLSPVAAIGSGALKGLFGTDKGVTQTQSTNNSQTTNNPWSGVQPYLLDLFQRGQSSLDAGTPLTGQAAGTVSGMLSPGFLNPANNPAFRDSVNDALGLARSQFAGQYGGPAGQNLGNSGYQESLARGLGAAATNAYADQYNRNLSAQLGAVSAAPGLDAAASPFSNLEHYKSLLSLGLPFGQSSTQGTGTNQTPYYQNNTAQTLGIAATALPFLMMSDVRTKENIERVGTHDSGAGLYKYNYKGNPTPQIGVLAQEMEQVKPEAVHEIDGIRYVDFRMI